MKCLKCGTELPDDSLFCQYCGQRIDYNSEAVEEPLTDSSENVAPESAPEAASREEMAKGSESKHADMANEDCIEKMEKKKPRFCKYCGGLIDPDKKRCTSCGKQFFYIPQKTALVAAALIILLALAGLNIYQYTRYEKMDKYYTGIEEQLRVRLSAMNDLYQGKAEKYREIDEKVEFLEKDIAFVSNNYYHKYTCRDLDLSRFVAYDKDAAIARGYTECPVCHPSLRYFLEQNQQG